MNTHLSGLAEGAFGAAGCRYSRSSWCECGDTYPERVGGEPRRATQDLDVSYVGGLGAHCIRSARSRLYHFVLRVFGRFFA